MKFCSRETRITENQFINLNDYREFHLPRLQNERSSCEHVVSFLCRYAVSLYRATQSYHISRTQRNLNSESVYCHRGCGVTASGLNPTLALTTELLQQSELIAIAVYK